METLQPITIEGKQFEAWHYLNDSKTTEVFYGGAAGGGKSFIGSIWHIYRRTTFPGSRGLIGRSSLTALEGSTLVTFFEVCRLQGYQNGIDFFYNQQKNVINWSNGSQTILKDLFLNPSDPDFVRLGSTEYSDAFIDEGTEITHKAFDIINSRLRWKLKEFNLIPKILVTCNPAPGWIKDNYILHPKLRTAIKLKPYQKFIGALLSDNPDKDFQKLYRTQLEKMASEYDKQRLLYGNWDIERDISSPFAYCFDPVAHVKETIVNYNRQLYISIDFNLDPFAVTFWQVYKENGVLHIEGIDEMDMVRGNIPEMGERIKSLFKQRLLTCTLTGDSMGNQRNMARRDNATHYMELGKILNLGPHQIKTPSNPTHPNSRAEVNTMLKMAKDSDGIKITLDPLKMPNTIQDFKIVQCDAFNSIMKRNRNDLAQRADYLDTARSLFHLVNLQFGLHKF